MFFSKASPGTLAPSQAPYLLTRTEFSLTIPIHLFHRASELEAAFKLGSFQLPTPHPIAGFAGKVILLLKSLDGCLWLLGHISKSSVKACMIWPLPTSPGMSLIICCISVCSSHIDLLFISSVSPLPPLSPSPT